MKGIVLAGGTGTRLRPITDEMSKHLVPVANEPVLQYALESFEAAGVSELGVIVGDQSRDEIVDLCETVDLPTTFVTQSEAKGVAHAVHCARDFVGDSNFLVGLGDNIVQMDFRKVVDQFENHQDAARLVLTQVDAPSRYGIAQLGPGGAVVDLVEKPQEPPSNLAAIGVYAFSPAIFDCIERIEPSWRGEYEITDAIQALIDTGHRVGCCRIDGWWKDVGTPEDVLDANRRLLAGRGGSPNGPIALEVGVADHKRCHPTATVREDAHLIGPVAVGENATICEGARVGPHASIGAGAVIAGARVENSVVMEDAVVESDLSSSIVSRSARISRSQPGEGSGENEGLIEVGSTT